MDPIGRRTGQLRAVCKGRQKAIGTQGPPCAPPRPGDTGPAPAAPCLPTLAPAPGQLVITAEAAALSQLVRAQVAGRHHSASAATHPGPRRCPASTVSVGRGTGRASISPLAAPHGSMADLPLASLTVPLSMVAAAWQGGGDERIGPAP